MSRWILAAAYDAIGGWRNEAGERFRLKSMNNRKTVETYLLSHH